MRKIALCVLLLTAFSFSWAGPDTDEYSINVHVSSSRWIMEPAMLIGPQPVQRLSVIIDGKKYELSAPATLKANLQAGVTLLALGDYKAKTIPVKVKDAHSYDVYRNYEFLFSDQKTRRYALIGITE